MFADRHHPSRVVAILLLCAGALVGATAAVAASAAAQRPAAPGSTGEIAGVVVDAAGRPLAHVEVTVEESGHGVLTDSAGVFRLRQVPVGPHLLRLRRVGLQPATVPLTVAAGPAPEYEIALDPVAQVLERMSIAAPRTYAMLGGQSFEQRRRMGFGSFFTPEDIERARAFNVAEILRPARGFHVDLDPRTRQWRIVSSRGGVSLQDPVCAPSLFLDGAPMPKNEMASLLNLIPVSNVLAIETNPGPATTPQEFGGTNAACGAVAIWTRTGPGRQRP